MRPLKLRLAVDRTTSASEGMPLQVPTHGPQDGVITDAPALTSFWMTPHSMAESSTSLEAGATISRTPLATCLPSRMFAAILRSSTRPLVQVPMNTWSSSFPSTFSIGSTLSTSGGQAICGESLLRSSSSTAHTWRPRPHRRP